MLRCLFSGLDLEMKRLVSGYSSESCWVVPVMMTEATVSVPAPPMPLMALPRMMCHMLYPPALFTYIISEATAL